MARKAAALVTLNFQTGFYSTCFCSVGIGFAAPCCAQPWQHSLQRGLWQQVCCLGATLSWPSGICWSDECEKRAITLPLDRSFSPEGCIDRAVCVQGNIRERRSSFCTPSFFSENCAHNSRKLRGSNAEDPWKPDSAFATPWPRTSHRLYCNFFYLKWNFRTAHSTITICDIMWPFLV